MHKESQERGHVWALVTLLGTIPQYLTECLRTLVSLNVMVLVLEQSNIVSIVRLQLDMGIVSQTLQTSSTVEHYGKSVAPGALDTVTWSCSKYVHRCKEVSETLQEMVPVDIVCMILGRF